MKSMLAFCRLLVYISSIVFLIASIRSKKRPALNSIKHSSVGSIIYLLADVFVFSSIFDIELGFEILFIAGASLVSVILMIVSIIVCNIRSKKIESTGNEENARWPILYILFAVCFISMFLIEVQVYQDANILLFNQPDGFSSDYYTIAVTDKACVRVEIGERYCKDGGREAEYYEYEILQVGVDEFEITSPYFDPELKEIDREVVKTIYQFDNFEKNESARNLFGDDWMMKGLVRKVVGTDYYIVLYLMCDSVDDGGTVYGEAIFLNDQFVGDLDIGNIDKIVVY